MARIDLAPLVPEEAVAYFEQRGFAPADQRFDWRDVWRVEHAHKKVVAKAVGDDVLRTIYDDLGAALRGGGTLEQFRQGLEPKLRALGWWGRQSMTDPLTGETRLVQLGSPHRLRVIYDANMRAAHAAGKWARIQRVKADLPYLLYRQIQRPTSRDAHEPFNGVVLPVDHPLWARIYPPNGWFCGCSTQQLSEAALARRGLQVTDPPPDLDEQPWVNRRTGETEMIPRGVDPGWDANPGMARFGPDAGGPGGTPKPPPRLPGPDGVQPGVPGGPVLPDAPVAGPARQPPSPYGRPTDGPPTLGTGPRGETPRGPLSAIDDAAVADVHRHGLATGRERVVAYDVQSGESFAASDGAVDRVDVSPEMRRAMSDPSRQIVAVHNHPGSTSFSQADIRALTNLPGMDEVVAVGHDGSIYRASYRGVTREAARIVQAVDAEWRTALQTAVNARVIDPPDADQVHAHLVQSLASELAGYTYEAVPSARQEAILARHGDLFARMLGAILEGLT